MVDIWVVAAMEAELDGLREAVAARQQGLLAGFSHYLGELGPHRIRLGVVGIGLASASLALGAFFARHPPDRALMAGTAGALPGAGLRVKDLVCADREILPELGLLQEQGISRRLKFPGVVRELPLDHRVAQGLCAAGRKVCSTVVMGPSLTVLGVSAAREQGLARARAFSALSENMEGFALALAARRMGIPCGEIRGISNIAGDNDKRNWDFAAAEKHAQAAVLRYLEGLKPETGNSSREQEPCNWNCLDVGGGAKPVNE